MAMNERSLVAMAERLSKRMTRYRDRGQRLRKDGRSVVLSWSRQRIHLKGDSQAFQG